jgi:tRNA(fMet)-specific endonuclease VapC
VRILDSDHCIDILRGQLDLREYANPDEELAITAISVGELTHGAHRSVRSEENLTRLDAFLAAVTVLPYDERSARRFGFLKAHLEREGGVIGDLDLQIASVVLENNALLLTHSQEHFRRAPGLGTEDWLA